MRISCPEKRCEEGYNFEKLWNIGRSEWAFLPKELYFPEAGTAETSVCIEKGLRNGDKPEIVIRVQSDKMHWSLFDRAWLKLWLTYKMPPTADASKVS